MLPEGQQLSHYRLVRLLRSGGMGEVYLAEDMLLHRQVAIKVIQTDAFRYAETDVAKEAIRLFIRESQAIAQLDHPNILPVYDSGEEHINGIAMMYMVMPYRREGSLKDWLQTHLGRQELLPLPAVERIVREAASALQHAHNHQIIHQDVKPPNFLVHGEAEQGSQLNLQLADFGVAKFMMTSETQAVRGTPSYMAPEQWEGHPVPATDQYALAAMAYELLTGRPPFIGNSYQSMWYQHSRVEPGPPSAINPTLPKELDAVILRALAKSPEKRYNSVSAFAQAFQRALLNSGDVYETVTISMLEARDGTNRVLALPTGQWVTVTIPPGAYHGQVIRMEGYGGPITRNGPMGALVVTIAVAPAEAVVFPADAAIGQNIPPPVANKYDAGHTPVVSRYDAGHTPVLNRYDAGHTPGVSGYDPGPTLPGTYHRKRQARGAALMIAFALVLLVAVISFYYIKNSGSTVQVTPTTTAVTATATTPITGYPSYLRGNRGTFALVDPLNGSNEVLNWDLANGTCNFTGGALDARIVGDPTNPGYFRDCIEKKQSFINFAFEVKLTYVTGDSGDCGGVIFRGDLLQESKLYYYYVCQDGRYGLVRYGENVQNPTINPTLRRGNTQLVKAGAGQTNLIAVVAQGFNFDLYVNQHYIDSVRDAGFSYSAGVLGVLVKSFGTSTTEVKFSDARVWTL